MITFRSLLLVVVVCFWFSYFSSTASAFLHPSLGAFLERDPIQSGTAIPIDKHIDVYPDGLNIYAYERNDPLFLLDATGLNAYGHYCGPGPYKGRPKPIDELDTCCQKHDDCYKKCKVAGVWGVLAPGDCARNCDNALCNCSAKADCKTLECQLAQNAVGAIFCSNAIRLCNQ